MFFFFSSTAVYLYFLGIITQFYNQLKNEKSNFERNLANIFLESDNIYKEPLTQNMFINDYIWCLQQINQLALIFFKNRHIFRIFCSSSLLSHHKVIAWINHICSNPTDSFAFNADANCKNCSIFCLNPKNLLNLWLEIVNNNKTWKENYGNRNNMWFFIQYFMDCHLVLHYVLFIFVILY